MRIYSRKIPPIEVDEVDKAALLLTEEYAGDALNLHTNLSLKQLDGNYVYYR